MAVQVPIDPKVTFAELMKTVVAPALKAEGFAKNAATFVRRRGELIDVINVQGSDRNGLPDRHSFFLNVAVLSVKVSETLGITVPARPKSTDGLWQKRAADVSGSRVDRIDIARETDATALGHFVTGELSALFGFLKSLVTTSDLMEVVIEQNGAAQATEIAGYLVRVGDEAGLVRYLTTLHTRLATRANWPVIATRMRMAMGDLAPARALALLPDDIVSWAAPPSWWNLNPQ